MRVASKKAITVLVIDVGGTHVKVLATGQPEERKIPSGSHMTARLMVRDVKRVTKDWEYSVVSIGYPGPVIHGRALHEPHNLGDGWVGFDFAKAFGCPVKLINDAAMQALGSYEGGRMLFLGFGAGLGAAMIVDGVLEPMELAHLPYEHGKLTRITLVFAASSDWAKRSGGVTSPTLSKGLRTLWTPSTLC